jgi:hypothetical protein
MNSARRVKRAEGGPCFKNIQLKSGASGCAGIKTQVGFGTPRSSIPRYPKIQKSETRSFENLTCLGEGGGQTLRGEGGGGTLSKKELKAWKRPCSLSKQHQRNEKARRSEGADQRNRPLIKTGAKRKIEER